MGNMELWDKLRTPPQDALKTIKGGRLSGMTDISPTWRYEKLTEELGVCGEGWKYEIVRMWLEPGPDNQVFAFAHVNLYKRGESTKWCEAIPGVGGAMLIALEHDKQGNPRLHANDEAYKMAITDAIGTAANRWGLGADVYRGKLGSNTGGGKYAQPVGADTPPEQPAYQTPTGNSTKLITPKQVGLLKVKCKQANVGTSELCSFLGVSRLEAVQRGDMDRALKGLEAGKIKAAQAEPGALPWEKDEPERLDKTLTEIANCPTREALVKIGKDIKTSEASFSEESISTLRAAYKEREAELA